MRDAISKRPQPTGHTVKVLKHLMLKTALSNLKTTFGISDV